MAYFIFQQKCVIKFNSEDYMGVYCVKPLLLLCVCMQIALRPYTTNTDPALTQLSTNVHDENESQQSV